MTKKKSNNLPPSNSYFNIEFLDCFEWQCGERMELFRVLCPVGLLSFATISKSLRLSELKDMKKTKQLQTVQNKGC